MDSSGLTVTAVLVCHNGAEWLPATLASLRDLTHRPDEIVAVDTGSDDGSLELLGSAGIFDLAVAASARDGFGRAVCKGLTALEQQRHQPQIRQPNQRNEAADEWLWLLHDDISVDPAALQRLLECAASHPDADVIGPKLLQPAERDRPAPISELGVSISDTGRRELDLEPGEIDQGQHLSTEVLAVSTCGMLVRRSVFDELDGFAPELPVFRDGVDFGWRATAAGHRVRTCPAAMITHRQVGRAGLRRSRIVGRNPTGFDRLLGMRTVAAHRGRAASLRLIWGGLLRAVGFLLAKAPKQSRTELRVVRAFVDPAPVEAMRARIRSPVDAAAAARVRALRPPPWSSVQVGAETVRRFAVQRWQALSAPATVSAAEGDTSLDGLTGDDFAVSGARRRRSAWANPLIVLLGVGVLATLIAARGLIRPGLLSSEQLLPARGDLGDAYRAYLTPIIGAPDMAPPPWLGWTALGSTLTAGQPDWFVGMLVIGAPVLALLTAVWYLRRVVADPHIRLLAASMYAVLPVLLAAVNRGQLAVGVLAVLLPILAASVRALLVGRTHGPESWRASWATGLLLAIVVAFVPSLLFLIAAATLAGALVFRRDARRLRRVLVAVSVPALLLAPWWPSITRNWSRLLVGPDAGLGGLPVNPAWELMVGRTPGPSLPPLWLGVAIFGLLWLLGVLGALLRPTSPALLGAWAVVLGAGALAIVLSRQLASVLPQGTRVRPEVTTLLLVSFAALVLAAALGFDRIPAVLRGRGSRLGQAAMGLVGVAVVTALLSGTVWWAVSGATGPLERTRLDTLPPYLRNAMLSEARTRVLAIEFQAAVPHWSLISDDQLRLGDADRGLTFGGSGSMQQRTDNMVARLVGGAGDDRVAEDLASIAVGHVWVGGATAEQRARIDNTPGLGAASGDEEAVVWSVPATSGRMVVTGGAEPVVVPSGADGRGRIDLPASERARQLTIAEPTDRRWRITYGGNELPTRTAADRTLVDLPPQAGRLEVGVYRPIHAYLALLQLLAVIVLLGLAAPSCRSQSGDVR